MELKKCFEVVTKRLWLIIVIPLVFAAVSYIGSRYFLSPVYEAKASLVVGIMPTNTKSYQMQYDDLLMYEKLMKTYCEIITSKKVADETLEKLNNNITSNALQSKLNVTSKGESQVIEISYQDTDPIRAADVANTVSQVFINNVIKMMNSNDIDILDKAPIPNNPIKPRVPLNTTMAFLLGFIISLGLIFLIEYLDNTLKTEDDIEKYLAVTVIANVPYVKEK